MNWPAERLRKRPPRPLSPPPRPLTDFEAKLALVAIGIIVVGAIVLVARQSEGVFPKTKPNPQFPGQLASAAGTLAGIGTGLYLGAGEGGEFSVVNVLMAAGAGALAAGVGFGIGLVIYKYSGPQGGDAQAPAQPRRKRRKGEEGVPRQRPDDGDAPLPRRRRDH